jgi:hypothetical protein
MFAIFAEMDHLNADSGQGNANKLTSMAIRWVRLAAEQANFEALS